MPYKQTTVLNNKEITSGYFLMRLKSPTIAKNFSPGQFLHIKCSTSSSPLLRRPLSIHRVKDNRIEILYKIKGRGTYWLSERKRGEKIDCLGPLGNGFRLPEVRSQKSEVRKILVAGGIGIAPLFFLAEQLAKTEHRTPITAFIGAKTKDEVLCAEELKSLGAEVHISTEDGSMGYKGLVSDLLKERLSTIDYRLSTIYSCGPKGMLKEIASISQKHRIPCQVSFEQFMGCGIGICNACVIKTKHGYKKVCKDGPVFDAEEIDWSKI